MSGITINLPAGTDAATADLVRQAIDDVVVALTKQWADALRDRALVAALTKQWTDILGQRDRWVAASLRSVNYAGSDASTAAIEALRAAMPDVAAAITAPKVQTIEHDHAGRIVSITTTAT